MGAWLGKAIGAVGGFFGNAATTVATTMSGTNFKLYFHIGVIVLIIFGFIGMRIWVGVLKSDIETQSKKIEQLTKEVAGYEKQVELKEAMIKSLENAAKLKDKQIVTLIETIERWKGNKLAADEEKKKVDDVIAEIEKLNSTNKVVCKFTNVAPRPAVVAPVVVRPVAPVTPPSEVKPTPKPDADTVKPDTDVYKPVDAPACSVGVMPANYVTTDDNGFYAQCPDTRKYVELINQLFLKPQ